MTPERRGETVSNRLGWWCPSCDRFLTKPPYKNEGLRYHSYKCQTPMRRARSTVIAAPLGDAS